MLTESYFFHRLFFGSVDDFEGNIFEQSGDWVLSLNAMAIGFAHSGGDFFDEGEYYDDGEYDYQTQAFYEFLFTYKREISDILSKLEYKESEINKTLVIVIEANDKNQFFFYRYLVIDKPQFITDYRAREPKCIIH